MGENASHLRDEVVYREEGGEARLYLHVHSIPNNLKAQK
jgi:hypothetical protein